MSTQRSTRRAGLALALAALVTLSLGACTKSSGGGNNAATPKCPLTVDKSITTTARIAYQAIPNGDLIVKDQAILESCMPNAKITWSKFDSGGDVIQAMGSGSLDLGLVGSSPSTKALSKPLLIPLQVVWIHDVIGTAESLVVKDPSITDIKGLAGKTIATPFSSTSHFSLLQALAAAGMDSNKDVTLVNLAPDKMPAAWQGGQIDAAWVWDPTLSVLKKDGHVIESSADTAKTGVPTYDLGVAMTDFAQKNAAFMTMWAKAEDYAVKLITSSPADAAISVAAQLGISPTDAQAQFAGLGFLTAAQQAGPDHLGGKLADELYKTAQFLLTQGGIDQVNTPDAYKAGVNVGPAQSVG